MVNFKYSLTYDEAFEAFYRLAARRSPRARGIVAVSLIVLAAALIVLYAFYPNRFEYFFLPLLVLATYFGVVYYPRFKARRGAKNVAATGGIYQVSLDENGYIYSASEKVELKGDHDARAFETDTLFIIRPDRLHTFCIPKRVMNETEVLKVRNILTTAMKKFIIETRTAPHRKHQAIQNRLRPELSEKKEMKHGGPAG